MSKLYCARLRENSIFSAALGNMSKLYCARLRENSIFSAALGNMSKLYCARLRENSIFTAALVCAKIREISATDQVAILLIERD